MNVGQQLSKYELSWIKHPGFKSGFEQPLMSNHVQITQTSFPSFKKKKKKKSTLVQRKKSERTKVQQTAERPGQDYNLIKIRHLKKLAPYMTRSQTHELW